MMYLLWIYLILNVFRTTVSSYDAYMRCGSRTKKQMYLEKNLPCELTKENWCSKPGKLYPWRGIRDFLLDNQGLMRRMYGSIRQRSLFHDRFMDEDSLPILQPNTFASLSKKLSADIKIAVKTKLKTGNSSKPQPNTVSTSTLHSSTTETTSTASASTIDDWTPEEVYATLSLLEELSTTSPLDKKKVNEDEMVYGSQNEILEDEKEEEPLFRESFPSPLPPLDYIDKSSKGINACPSKEEVVAPYWSNNTRGEVLALLNLYPFEQYVHWEKCAYEHRQMFCREGCRCEQQYRMHRMLAFDPINECRGIFSDWFRYPSCCVCKCYNLTRNMYNSREMTIKPDPKPSSDIKSRQFSESKEIADKPIELSLNSLKYKIRGTENFKRFLQQLSAANNGTTNDWRLED